VQGFIITLLICSITMSILALMYMAVTPLLAKRYSEKGRYYAWLIIIVGLIIPFRPQWGNAFVSVEVPTHTVTMFASQLEEGALPIITNPTILLPMGDTAINNPTFIISWWSVSFAVWLIGAILFATYQIIKHYRFTKATKRWSENIKDKQILSVFENLKSEMGITKPVSIHLCSCVSSPMLVGIINPKILMPTANLAKDELRFILKHELVHFKRKDLLYKLLLLAATAVHWFNPIVYLSVKAINILCETSCDTEVVRDVDADTRQIYSKAIIGVVKYQSKLKTALSTNFYGGKKGMKNRISSIMDTRMKKAGILISCVILTLAMGTSLVLSVNAATTLAPRYVYGNPLLAGAEDGKMLRIEDFNNATLFPGADIGLHMDYELPANAQIGEWNSSFPASLNNRPIASIFVLENAESGVTFRAISTIEGNVNDWMYRNGFTPVYGEDEEILFWADYVIANMGETYTAFFIQTWERMMSRSLASNPATPPAQTTQPTQTQSEQPAVRRVYGNPILAGATEGETLNINQFPGATLVTDDDLRLSGN